MRLFLFYEKLLMRFVNASIFWRRQGRDMSSSSWSRYLPLDFQCPVSSSSLSEESLGDGLMLFRHLCLLSSKSELDLLRRLRRLSSESKIEGLSLGEYLRPSLSWTLRLPSLAWALVRNPSFSHSSRYCESVSSSSTIFLSILVNTGCQRLSLSHLLFWWRGGDASSKLSQDRRLWFHIFFASYRMRVSRVL